MADALLGALMVLGIIAFVLAAALLATFLAACVWLGFVTLIRAVWSRC